MIRTLFTSLFLLIGTVAGAEIRPGADCTSKWLPRLDGQRVAVLCNHTATVGKRHLVDFLVEKKVNLCGIFSPEHGFRGTADAGQKVNNSVDELSGKPIWSLYSATKEPNSSIFNEFDILLVDIQDVGLRFYTYYITMLEMVDRCSIHHKKVIVLDRPNPNGMYIDGPILDLKYSSGVGRYPIPVVHGLTMGEIVRMAIGEKWVGECEVYVAGCEGYTHGMKYNLPISPSPNLKTMHAIYLYPSTCLFEGTICSLGRGTQNPFEMYGHPKMKESEYCFTPASMSGAKHPPLENQLCYGVDLRSISDDEIIQNQINLDYVIDAYRKMGCPEKFFTPFFEKLIGVDYVRRMIIDGKSSDDIRQMWQGDLVKYKAMRLKYILYAD